MPLFFIDYDLRKPGRNYQTLYDELNRLKAKPVLESLWCAYIAATPVRLRDHLKSFIDANDGLSVVEVDETKWATYNTKNTPKTFNAPPVVRATPPVPTRQMYPSFVKPGAIFRRPR